MSLQDRRRDLQDWTKLRDRSTDISPVRMIVTRMKEGMNMKRIRLSKKTSVLLPLAFLMMGNQECQQPKPQPEARELRRRVEMGAIETPSMSLPEGKNFDFKFVANAQLYDVLRKTQSFSTSTMDGTFPLEQMTQADRDAFNRCDDDVLNPRDSLGGHAKPGQISTVATCMIGMPQAVIQGSIDSFELTNSAGISFNILQPLNLGASFDMKKATLTMSFKAEDPFIPGHVLATSNPKANRFETSLSATIDFGAFSVGPRAYFKSSLAGVVQKAMSSGITDLKNQMNQATPWYATVLRNCDKALLINAGSMSDAGLKEGDVLEVYNVRYEWSGNVCDSTLKGSIPSTPVGSPIAVVKVDIVGDTVSQASVIEQTATKIEPGARVYVRKLVQPPVPPQGQDQGARLAGQN